MIKVFEQALEALEDVSVLTHREWQAVHKNKANELRQAIAELESQEPVAWRFRTGTWWNREVHWRYVLSLDGTEGLRGLEPLYTHPPQRTEQEPVANDFFRMIADRNPKRFPLPQRTWVGLTDEEIDHIYTGVRAVHHDVDSYVFCRAIEARLKQNNGYVEEKNT